MPSCVFLKILFYFIFVFTLTFVTMYLIQNTTLKGKHWNRNITRISWTKNVFKEIRKKKKKSVIWWLHAAVDRRM